MMYGLTASSALIILISLSAGRANSAELLSTQLSINGPGPSPRWGHAITVSTDGQTLYLFGGSASETDNGLNDFWQLNMITSQWTPIVAVNSGTDRPGKRYLHKMHFYNNTVFVMGGVMQLTGPTYSSDAWAFSLDTWRWSNLQKTWLVPTANAPYFESVLDEASGKSIVIVNGVTGTGNVDIQRFSMDTSQLSPVFTKLISKIPQSRNLFRIAVNGQQLFLFGGFRNSQVLRDLWLFNFASMEWQMLKSCDSDSYGTLNVGDPANCPPARIGFSMLYASPAKSLIIFGGSRDITGDMPLNDVWQFRLNDRTWIWIGSTENQERTHGAFADIPGRNISVLHGGMKNSTTFLAGLWLIRITSDDNDNTPHVPQNNAAGISTLIIIGLAAPAAVFVISLIYWCYRCRDIVAASFASLASLTNLSKYSKDLVQNKSMTSRELTGSLVSVKSAPLMRSPTEPLADVTVVVHSALAIPGYAQYFMNKDFKVGKVLADGGFGKVMLVKLLNNELKTKVSSDVAVLKAVRVENQKDTDVFLQEVSLLAYFGRFTQFPQFLGYEPKLFGVLMKYYPAGSLSKYRRSCDQWTKTMMVDLLLDVATAVSIMHQKGYVHCDLKAQNVLIDHSYLMNRDCAVLVDFGLTRNVDKQNRQVKAMKPVNPNGMTPTYTAPEILQVIRQGRGCIGDPLVAKAGDVYAFACIIYDLMTDIGPWRGECAVQK